MTLVDLTDEPAPVSQRLNLLSQRSMPAPMIEEYGSRDLILRCIVTDMSSV